MSTTYLYPAEPKDEEFRLLTRLMQLGGRSPKTPAELGRLLEVVKGAIDASTSQDCDHSVWLYYRIAVPSWEQAAQAIPGIIWPIMDVLSRKALIHGWWWLYKQDLLGSAIRLRLFIPRHSVDEVDCCFIHAIAESEYQVFSLVYEPEIHLFGGPEGIETAHKFFCADSRFLARWAVLDASVRDTIVPAGLSVALIIRLLSAAKLDSFEIWGFMEKLAATRSAGSPADNELLQYRKMLTMILPSPNAAFSVDYGKPSHLLVDYVEQVSAVGEELHRLYFSGRLGCGLREILVPLVLFHWNRVGFGQRMQRNLSVSLAQAYRDAIGRSISPNSVARG